MVLGGPIMRIVSAVLVLMLCAVPLAFAGNIYGTITEGGKPVTKGVKLEIACGDSKYSGETDANGGYKMFVKDQGKCVLKVTQQNQSATLDINSYEGSVQYDLILEKQGAGYTLKRK
jgi:hypothetical protein